MADAGEKLARASELVVPGWDDARTRRGVQALGRRLRSRRRLRAVAAFAIVAILSAGAGAAVMKLVPTEQPVVLPAPPAPADRSFRFADGSVATPLGDDAVLAALLESPSRMAVEVRRGRAAFDVTHRRDRTFRVEAGPVTVIVVGTAFEVERLGERARVAVTRGRVRVEWPDGSTELAAGEGGLFPPVPVPAPAPDLPPTPPPLVAPEAEEPDRPRPDAARRWQELANEGDFDEAYAVMSAERTPVRDHPSELLLAADVARHSGHPADAVAPLRQLLANHAGDPRATLAAFPLGRIHLEQLGRPREAAAAFARARALAPNGSLAEDALAREGEAWSRAGDQARAAERAREYLARYPDGRRARSVARFGGIE